MENSAKQTTFPQKALWTGLIIITSSSQAPVPHTYNPSYLGGRNQEHRGLKPA
jgi:hypothetical protein